MADTTLSERARQFKIGGGGAGGDSGMGFRMPDLGVAAKGQSAEFLNAAMGMVGAAPQVGAAEAPPPQTTEKAPDNAPAKGDAKDAEAQQDAAAKADWEAFLGKSIGGKLFDLVKENVDKAKLTKYAEQGTKALAKEFGKLGDKIFKDDKGQADAVNGLLTALAPELQKLADKWLEGPDGQKILKAVSDWTEEHPRTVTATLGAAIIGAAVAAYVSNLDPPALGKMFKLGKGFKAGGSIDFGPIQKLAVQAASATVEYESKSLTASLSAKMSRAEDGTLTTSLEGEAKGQIGENTTVTGKGSVSRTGDKTSASLEGGVESKLGKDTTVKGNGQIVMNPDGSSTLKLDGGLDTKLGGKDVSIGGGFSETKGGTSPGREVNGRFKLGDDKEGITADGKWNPQTNSFNLSFNRTALEGKARQNLSLGQDDKGQRTSSAGFDYDISDKESIGFTHTQGPDGNSDSVRYKKSGLAGGRMDVNAQGTVGKNAGMDLGVKFTEGDFKAALDYELKDQVNKLGGSFEYANDKGWNAGANFKADLDAGRFDHYGFHLGWKDPKQFRSFMLKYDAEWDAAHPGHKHALELSAEQVLGGVETRLTGKVGWDGQGNSNVDVNLMGAKQLNKDWRAIGGVGYRGGEKDGKYDGGMVLQAGVQYKQVPLVLSFDPKDKKVMLGVTIPFGR